MERTEWRLDLSKLKVGRAGFEVKVCTWRDNGRKTRLKRTAAVELRTAVVKPRPADESCKIGQRTFWNLKCCKVNASTYSLALEIRKDRY